MCWTQSGVESTEQTITPGCQTSEIQSLLEFDENNCQYVLLGFNNSRLECYKSGVTEAVWKYDIPWPSQLIETFKAKDCPLTRKNDKDIMLCAISKIPYFLPISPRSPPSTENALIVALPEVYPFINQI